jgi:tetratricopeptide (TPR) repeat protein
VASCPSCGKELPGEFPFCPFCGAALAAASEAREGEGDWGHFASVAPLLGEALVAQGRADEAVEPVETAVRWTLADDTDAQISLLRMRSKLAAHRGSSEEAEALARQAIDRASQSDDPNFRGATLVDLAELLELSGRAEERDAALEQALAFYEQKGNVVMAERVRERLRV